MTPRAAVVAAARGWLETPFHHQARVKGEGCDCLGLLIGVARELALVAPDFDVSGYSRQPDGRTLLDECDRYMHRIGRSAMQPGDVVIVAFDADPQHVGVLGDYRNGGLSIIHALGVTARRVVETRLMFTSAMRFVAAYSLPGVS